MHHSARRGSACNDDRLEHGQGHQCFDSHEPQLDLEGWMSEDSNDPFSVVMDQLRTGDESAATQVFRRFVRRLVGLACRQFRSGEIAVADPEGVVQSAFRSLFRRIRNGQFEIDGWQGLWGLLTIITLRKCGQRRSYLRAKRRTAGALPVGTDVWRAAIDRDPTPLEAATMADLVRSLLDRLDPIEKDIVALTLEGYTASEVAEQLDRSERTVWRIREGVRARLRRLIDDPEPRSG
jgi:RNA polymerase sigma-70 factor (ECF subfamily)